MLNFDLNYRDEDGEIIHEYESADSDRMSYDGLYSELLDKIIGGLDTFAQDPLWSDGVSGFDRFEELMTRTTLIDGYEYGPVIFDQSKIEEGLEQIKEAIVTMMDGFDFDG